MNTDDLPCLFTIGCASKTLRIPSNPPVYFNIFQLTARKEADGFGVFWGERPKGGVTTIFLDSEKPKPCCKCLQVGMQKAFGSCQSCLCLAEACEAQRNRLPVPPQIFQTTVVIVCNCSFVPAETFRISGASSSLSKYIGRKLRCLTCSQNVKS